jgi:hypothetical protein
MVVVDWGHAKDAQTALRIPRVSASQAVELCALPDARGLFTYEYRVDPPRLPSELASGFSDLQVVLSDEPPSVFVGPAPVEPDQYLLLFGGRYRASQFTRGVSEDLFLLENISGARIPPCVIRVRTRDGGGSVGGETRTVHVPETSSGGILKLSLPNDGAQPMIDPVWVMQTRSPAFE